MLLDFEVSNILSFNGKSKFSMQSGYSRADIFNSNVIYDGPLSVRKKTYVQNAAILYGANASGKSNLIYAISFMKNLVENSFDEETEPIPFRFNEDSKPSTFSINFIQELDKTKYEYIYKVEINEDGFILGESLSFIEILKASRGTEDFLFKREEDEFTYYHEDIKEIIENYKTNNIETKAALSCFINDINKSYFKETMNTFGYKMLLTAYNFIINKIVISSETRDKSTIANEMMENPFLKEKVITALNEIDNSIENFEIIDITQMISERMKEILKDKNRDEIPQVLLHDLDQINKKKKKVFDFKTVHRVGENDYHLEYVLESSGTRKFIDEFIDIVDCIENNKVYIIDEIENHYHELIQQYILDLFLNQEENKSAQIIASTHSIEFLDPQRFAKEQIWFVEKDRESQETHLYRMSEFKDLTYNNHNWKNLYLQGRFGAVPKVIM